MSGGSSCTNICSCRIARVQLALDSLDRLVELLEEKGGRARASEAAAQLFAVKQAPEGLARQLLGPLVDGDARLCWRGSFVALVDRARPAALAGRVRRLRPRDDRARERLRAHLRDRRRAHPRPRARRRVPDARRAEDAAAPPDRPPHRPHRRAAAAAPQASRLALRRFSRFAGGAVLVAHNARFDVGLRQPRARADDRQAPARDRDRHRAARAQPARPARPPHEPRLARVLLRRLRPAVPPRAPRRAGDGGGLPAPDRARARAGRAPRSPSSRSSRRRARAACTRSATSSTARRSGPASTSSTTPAARCSTSARRATCAPRLRSYFHTQRQRPSVEAALDDGRAHRVARARLRARRRARGDRADPQPPPARERAARPRPSATSTCTRAATA